MEFLKVIPANDLESNKLKNLLTLKSLPVLCAAIDTVSSEKENEADIYCIWGEFNVRRDEIKHGVRFSLLNCPHALSWTITFDKVNQKIIIHCTIDKSEQEQDFIESIDEFVADWSQGITEALR